MPIQVDDPDADWLLALAEDAESQARVADGSCTSSSPLARSYAVTASGTFTLT